MVHTRAMSLEAIALLRLADHVLRDGDVRLSDALLVRTGASFASEPEALALGLRRLLGDALEGHEDLRGVFIVPSVALEAATAAGDYAAAIEAIGEAGMWVTLAEDVTTARPTMVEALMARAMDGDELDPEALQTAVQASFAQLAGSFGVGQTEGEELEGEGTNPGAPALDLMALLQDPAMRALAEKMRDFMPPAGEDEDDADDDDFDGEPTDGAGVDVAAGLPFDVGAFLGTPAFAEMLRNARDLLANNPEEAQKLAARFGLDVAALAGAEGDAEDDAQDDAEDDGDDAPR